MDNEPSLVHFVDKQIKLAHLLHVSVVAWLKSGILPASSLPTRIHSILFFDSRVCEMLCYGYVISLDHSQKYLSLLKSFSALFFNSVGSCSWC